MKIRVSEWELEDKPEVNTEMRKRAGTNTNFGELTREEAVKQFNPSLLNAPGIPEIKRCELYNKYRPLVPLPHQDIICPKPPKEVLENQKKIKNDKVRAKAHAKKKKPTKTKDKETRTDETNKDGEEESKIAEQQVVAAAAADGPRAVPMAAAAGPQAGMMPFPVMASWMPQMPHQYNPNPYLYSGFHPFHNLNNYR